MSQLLPKPYYERDGVRLYVGDVLERLVEMPDESVNCVVTSPPYFGLRDYGTATWKGGDPECKHLPNNTHQRQGQTGDRANRSFTGFSPFKAKCGNCGARRVDQQLGLEATPEEYVAKMTAVFREVRRVLRKDGVCFVNMGDCYAAGGTGGYSDKSTLAGFTNPNTKGRVMNESPVPRSAPPGLKPKDLVGMPWRLAFALQADGWYLRSDIIWSKPNPMPESVTDRPTKAHEYIFLLTKSATYWYDADAIREPNAPESAGNRLAFRGNGAYTGHSYDNSTEVPPTVVSGMAKVWNGRNKRTVWEIATEPFFGVHFATFPTKLVEPCILAGCPEWVCRKCGKPRERLTSVGYVKSPVHGAGSVVGRHETTGANGYDGSGMPRLNKEVTTLGWTDCGHEAFEPGVVLDPFAGSGTTLLVARRFHRQSIGIELNPEYAKLAVKRLEYGARGIKAISLGQEVLPL